MDMPVNTGWEVIEACRRHRADLPIIMQTGEARYTYVKRRAEEFGIVLPRADYVGVLSKAEAIRSRIERETFTQGLETIKITVSIGIAHYPRDGATGEAAVAAADKALYHAKDTGRNRIVDIAQI